jgi:hypothetical protein
MLAAAAVVHISEIRPGFKALPRLSNSLVAITPAPRAAAASSMLTRHRLPPFARNRQLRTAAKTKAGASGRIMAGGRNDFDQPGTVQSRWSDPEKT